MSIFTVGVRFCGVDAAFFLASLRTNLLYAGTLTHLLSLTKLLRMVGE